MEAEEEEGTAEDWEEQETEMVSERKEWGELERVEIKIYGHEVEEVQAFKYLGRILRADGEEGDEIRARVTGARRAQMALMLPLYRRDAVTRKTKMAVFRAVTRAQLMYASQTWVLKEKEWRKIETLEMQGLRRVAGMHPKMTPLGLRYPSNDKVLEAAESCSGQHYMRVRAAVQKGRIGWWGKVMRMEEESLMKRVLLARIEGAAHHGWRGAYCLATSIKRQVEAAGLNDGVLWDRVAWAAAAAKAADASASSGGAAAVPCPPLAAGVPAAAPGRPQSCGGDGRSRVSSSGGPEPTSTHL